MKTIAFILSVAAVSLPAFAQTVEIGGGNWDEIPRLAVKGQPTPSDSTLDRMEKLRRGCPQIAHRGGALRFSVPFLAEFTPTGAPTRVVVKRIGCPEVEQVLAGTALAMVKSGYYKPTGENQAGWYRSEIAYFSE